ncbi:hypothetical protein AAG570_011733, partial [Ranatra chinensis]
PTPYQKRLVKHFEWRGLAPRRCPCPLVTSPACYVVIGHTVCKNYTKREDCEQQVRNIQHFHFSLGYNDIAYNFLVGGDGFIYEGVGWDHIGSHTKFFNGESIGIAFIGTFIDVLPPARQMEAAKALIEEGVRLGKLTPDYKLFLQSQLRSTESPGARLAEEIKTWPHYTPPVTFNERIKKRGHWFGLPPRGEILPLEVSPVHFVIVGHTAGNTYTDHVACRNAVRHIQASHFNKDMVDIGYSFLIGGDGFIYEGRGWDQRPALPEMVRSRTLFISLMGDFMFELPLPVQLEALFCLLEEGVRICKLTPDYKILTQKQVAATESPGMAFIEEIRKWPRWGYLD